MERERPATGNYFEIRADWIPRATFMVVEILAIDENFNVKTENMVPVFQGICSSADTLFGYSQVRKGTEEGKNMGILFHPEEVVVYPEGSNYA